MLTSYTANISGIVHNYYEIEFASTHPTTFGLRIAYDTHTANGTTKISMAELEIQLFTALDIGNLGEIQIDIDNEDGFDVGQALVIGGIAAAVIGIIAGIVIYLRRCGSV